MQCGNIEERSRRLKHGLLVLQLLEGSLDMKSEGPCAQSLSRFYSHIRSQLLAAQFSADATPLELQIALLLQVRESWQHLNASEAILEASRSAPDSVPAASCAATPEASADRSWSA
jgi:flagellin-specific chaperone FliS